MMLIKARREGITGDVSAQVLIHGDQVVSVEIIESNQKGVFDDAVRAALMASTGSSGTQNQYRSVQSFNFEVAP